jgi:hypothetical protein
VKTTSGGTAVQILHSARGSRDIEHVGPAHDEVELETAEALGMSGDHALPSTAEFCHHGQSKWL